MKWQVKNKPRGHIIGAMWSLLTKDKSLVIFKVDARVVRVLVAQSDEVGHWSDSFIGQERMAVQVRMVIPDVGDGAIDETFYLDNADSLTPFRLTIGHGDPRTGLRQLQIARLIDDPTIHHTYQCHLSSARRSDPSETPTQASGPSYYCSWLSSPLRFSR